MLQTVRAEKVDEKMGSFAQFPYFLSDLWCLNCLKKCIFCNFVLTLARTLSLLKQFTFMHFNGLASEILGFEVEKLVNVLLSQHLF